MAMKLKFKSSPKKYKGGDRYAVGKIYYLGKEEACLWIKRGVVDEKSLEPANLTDEAIAENEKNFQKGEPLTLQEVLTELKELAPA